MGSGGWDEPARGEGSSRVEKGSLLQGGESGHSCEPRCPGTVLDNHLAQGPWYKLESWAEEQAGHYHLPHHISLSHLQARLDREQWLWVLEHISSLWPRHCFLSGLPALQLLIRGQRNMVSWEKVRSPLASLDGANL